MKRLRNKMTTEELAECLGVAKQTVNRWIREKGWKTEKRIAEYAPGARAPAYRQIINAIDNMTDIEQEKVAQFLSREGIRNFLARLDIDESA